MALQLGSTKLDKLQVGSTRIGEGWIWHDNGWKRVYASVRPYSYFDSFDRLTDTNMAGTAYEADWILSPQRLTQPYVDAGGYFRSSLSTADGTESHYILHRGIPQTERYQVRATCQGAMTSAAAGIVVNANAGRTDNFLLAQFTSVANSRGLVVVGPTSAQRVATFATSTIANNTGLSVTCSVNESGVATYEVVNTTQNVTLCTWTDSNRLVSTAKDHRYGGLVVTGTRALWQNGTSNNWHDFEIRDL